MTTTIINKKNLRTLHRIFEIEFWGVATLAALAWLSAKLIPIAPFVGAAFVLVFIDQVTGRKAARKRGETITSKGLRRTIDKALVYMLFILAAHVLTDVFSIPFAAYIAALAVARVEFFSIDENVSTITGVSVWEHFKSAFDLAQKNKK